MFKANVDKNMKKLSLISHYYNSHEKAQRLVDRIGSVGADYLAQIELIIVDDGSVEEHSLVDRDVNLKHLRIVNDIPWNQAGARNLGALTCEGTWALFFDIDQLITAEALEATINGCDSMDPNTMYYFWVDDFVDSNTNTQLSMHPNTFLVNANCFRVNGMYDEDFAGNYGYEDLYLPYMWERNGGQRAIMGNKPFFADQQFKTTTLNRDLEPNKIKSQIKMAEGIKRPKNFIRFEWKYVEHKV